ncbi:MAG TPA: SDR family oxidoreductase [Sphingobium sp.]
MTHSKNPGGRRAIFVTGAASGIGRACAELFAGHGWFVGLYDINETAVATLADALGGDNTAYGVLDVRDPAAWQSALSDFWQQSGGRLDVLLNNAGVLSTGPFEETALQKHDAMVDINVGGMIAGCHTAYPYLKETPGSHVINMASATAIYGQPELATYSATKFAVRGFTEALDLEWRKADVRVSDIWPSFVKTAMAEDYAHIPSATSLGVRLSPGDVASVVWACATASRRRHKTHWTVGRQAGLLALGSRFAPLALTRHMVGKMAR